MIEFLIVFGGGLVINLICLVVWTRTQKDVFKKITTIGVGLTICCLPISIFVLNKCK